MNPHFYRASVTAGHEHKVTDFSGPMVYFERKNEPNILKSHKNFGRELDLVSFTAVTHHAP
jgi:hypothetical protein